MQQGVLIALAAMLGAIALEAGADRGGFRSHSGYHQTLRLPDAKLRLPDATPRLPAYSPRWGPSGWTTKRPGYAPKRHSRKSFHHRPRPHSGHYAPVYVTPVVVYPLSEVPDTRGYAYFCPDYRRYYPDVLSCPSDWLAVVPGAPGP